MISGELDENDDDDEDIQEGRNVADIEGKVTTGVQIKMYGIHTKYVEAVPQVLKVFSILKFSFPDEL